MVAALDLINHSDSVVGVGNNAFAFIIESKLFACENILACSFAVSLKITGGTDE